MKTIGIVGGIASGKSTVAREFARLGAEILNADEVAHRVLDEPEVKRQLVSRWGDDVLQQDGSVNRSRVSAKVFGPEAAEGARAFLEALIHPRVREELERQMQASAGAGTEVVVLDVPLLLEVGWDDLCDVVYFVDVPQEVRARRAAERGWSEAELANREAAQLAVDQKRSRADRVIQNAGSVQDLRRQIEQQWRDLTGVCDP